MKRGITMVWSLLWWVAFWIALWVAIIKIVFPWSIPLGFLGILLNVTLIPFVIVWFFWAPANLCFTFVKEGTAKIVVKGGKFHKLLIQWEGWTLDDNWDVIKENEDWQEGWHPFGGMRFYGIWPIHSIYHYPFQWAGIKENGEFEHHPPEILDFVLLKDDVYGCKVEKAEDRKLVPLDAEMTLTVRVVNPRKALFEIQNWFETLINRIRPYIRDFIGSTTYQELMEAPKGLKELMDQRIWDRLSTEVAEKGVAGVPDLTILEVFKNRYGIDIRKIETKDVNPPEIYRAATIKKYVGEREAEGRAAKTVGAYLEMLRQGTPKSLKEVRDAIELDPGLKADLDQFAKDLIRRQMSLDAGAMVDIHTSAGGIDGFLLSLVSLLRGAPGGKGMPGGRQRAVAPGSLQALTPQKRRPEPEPEMTDEEAQRYADDFERETEEEEEEEVK